MPLFQLRLQSFARFLLSLESSRIFHIFSATPKADNNCWHGGISKNNRFRDYFYPSEFCFWADFNWIKYKPVHLLKVNEMDKEWLRNDSSEFIFHYKLKISIRLENKRKITIEKWTRHFWALSTKKKRWWWMPFSIFRFTSLCGGKWQSKRLIDENEYNFNYDQN